MGRIEDLCLSMLFLEANDLNISDYVDYVDYIECNLDDLISKESLEYVQKNLLLASGERKNYLNIIKYLCMRYMFFNSPEDGTYRFLDKCNLNDALCLYEENDNFAMALLLDYFKNYNAECLKNEKEQFSIEMKYDPSFNVTTINGLIRNSIEVIYDLFNNPSSPVSPYDIVLGMNAGVIMLNGTNEEVVNAGNVLTSYRDFVPRVVYADVYADLIKTKHIMNSKNKTVQVVLNAIKNNDYLWPENIEDCYILLNHFLTVKDKRKKYGYYSDFKTKNLEKIRQINPMWILDESELFNKR